jgi:dihydroneopterin aldolase / 2-amino-4-hydroxy-6-hydroxymethyldihydropteridine diphosphokinase
MFSLVIHNLELMVVIGCADNERNLPQIVILNMKLELEDSAATDDCLSSTVDYAALVTTITTCVKGTNFYLLETLAKFIADTLMKCYTAIKQLNINLTKPTIIINNATIDCCYQAQRTAKVALALGANMQQPRQQIISAIELLSQHLTDIKIAPIYYSTPANIIAQDNFCNTCLSGNTILSPTNLLATTKYIEKLLGKIERSGSRIIDIDILLYNDLVYHNYYFVIPHTNMHLRDFVLKPLADIEPDWIHPVLEKDILTLYHELNDEQRYIIAVANDVI